MNPKIQLEGWQTKAWIPKRYQVDDKLFTLTKIKTPNVELPRDIRTYLNLNMKKQPKSKPSSSRKKKNEEFENILPIKFWSLVGLGRSKISVFAGIRG